MRTHDSNHAEESTPGAVFAPASLKQILLAGAVAIVAGISSMTRDTVEAHPGLSEASMIGIPSRLVGMNSRPSSRENDVTRPPLGPDAVRTHVVMKPDLDITNTKPAPSEHAVTRAIRAIKECQQRFESVNDYTCTFLKREKVKGRMTPQFVMEMKARTQPKSIYFKFVSPYTGREAIHVEGKNNGNILAHEVGITRLLAGTLEIEPNSARAMQENRHPITSAGIGAMIETICNRWDVELTPEESVVVIDENQMIDSRSCMLIESIHPRKSEQFNLHKVRLFIDKEIGLPIRFEGYDWPAEEGGEADLVEEYAFQDLKLNVGLDDVDFDAANKQYAFGRF
jgi:hypothetical protein